MMNYYLFVFLLITSVSNHATCQNKWLWASSSQGYDVEYLNIQAHPAGGTVALAIISHENTNQTPLFTEGNGASSKFGVFQNPVAAYNYLVIRMDEKGLVSWVREIKRPQYDLVDINAFTVSSNGDIFLVADIDDASDGEEKPFGLLSSQLERRNELLEEGEEYLDEEAFGEDAESFDKDYLLEDTVTALLNVIHLDSGGVLKRIIPLNFLKEETRINIESMYGLPDGSLLLAGLMEQGKLTDHISLFNEAKSADFILKIDPEGMPVWGDIIQHQLPANRSNWFEGTKVIVAPNGTIYLGAMLEKGGVFSNGKKLDIDPGTGKQSISQQEAYVVAYTPSGKLKWFAGAGCPSWFLCMAATNEGLCLATRITGNRLFGISVDTTGGAHSGLTFLNPKGKATWSIASLNSSYDEIVATPKGDFIVTGRLGTKLEKDKRFSAFKMDRNADIFVLAINRKGQFTSLWTGHTKVEYEKIRMNLDSDGQPVISVCPSCTKKTNLSYIHPNLRFISCYWTKCVLGKVNLSQQKPNTLEK